MLQDVQQGRQHQRSPSLPVLTLLITCKDKTETAKHQVTLHFYHTKDKIQVQGSTILHPGISSATWLAKHLIEPLAARHMENNQKALDQINNNIMSSASPGFMSSPSSASGSSICPFCSMAVNPRATQVKELPLFYAKCKSVFHKKCNNRRAVGRNWNKDSWYCVDCIAGNDLTQRPSSVLVQTQDSVSLGSNQPLQATPRLSVDPPGIQRLSLLQEDASIIGIHSTTSQAILDPDAPDFLPQNPTPVNNSSMQPRFPNNSIRQRSSNVRVTDPENEFLKTALDACRSNIVQQETELKKLNEGLDIRNKRIMQLENQVGVAETLTKVNDSLNLLLAKLISFTSQSATKTLSECLQQYMSSTKTRNGQQAHANRTSFHHR